MPCAAQINGSYERGREAFVTDFGFELWFRKVSRGANGLNTNVFDDEWCISGRKAKAGFVCGVEGCAHDRFVCKGNGEAGVGAFNLQVQRGF